MDVGSREYIFAIKLMTSVMELYNIKWKPKKTKFYVKPSPFTPVVKKAVEYIWGEKYEFIDDLFNTVLSMGTINMRNYKAAVEFAGHLVTEAEYDEIELLRYCVIASGYASLFYRKGLKDVPCQCIQLIYDVIMSFRAKNEFTDESWADIEILGEAYSVESPFKKKISNASSACFSQLSRNNRSDNFLQVVYPRNVEKKYASKTLHPKIKNPMQKCDRNDVDSFNNRYSTKSETEKSSSKLLKPKISEKKFEKTKSVKKKITNREDADEKVAEKRVVKEFGSNKITTTIPAKDKDAGDEIVASKYIPAEVEEDKDDDKPNAEQQCKSLKVENAKFKHKKITAKFKDYKAMENINAFVKFSMANTAVIGSEASKYVKKENENINKAVGEVIKDKNNKVKSETKSMGEKITYETKKFNRIDQASDEVPKTYNADEVADIEETSDRAEITKTKKIKNKKHKRRKSKKKTFKAHKRTLYEGTCKGVEDTNFTSHGNKEIEYASEGISKTNNTNMEDAAVLKDTDKKFNRIKIKTKKDKRTKRETNCGMFKASNVTPALKPIPKNFHETEKVALNAAVVIDTKKELNYNRKLTKIKYLTEMKNVKHGAQISETKLTEKHGQRAKYDKLEKTNDNFESYSETKNEYQEFATEGESAENFKASRKVTAEKNKFVKYKTKKFKCKSYKNKKAERIKHKVKVAKRIINSLEDSVPTNPVEGTKYSVEKIAKEVEMIKKKTKNKKLKAKKNVYNNKTSYKEVTKTMYASDEYVDVETIDESVEIASKKVVYSKKRENNTKSVKKRNIDGTSTGESSRPRRRSTRENIVNPIDITKEEHQIPSTSNEIEPTWKDPNIRNPGCEISNLLNVSANESSISIFRNKSQKNTSSEIHDQEPENKDPKKKSQPRDFKVVPLVKTTSSKTCNRTHSRKSISGAETKQENVSRNTTHSRHKSC